MNLSECFRKGLLKNIEPDIVKAREALILASHYISRAKGNIKIGYNDIALLCAYNPNLTFRSLISSNS